MNEFIQKRSIMAFLVLTLLGLVANFCPFTLHYQVDMIFGGIFSMLAICILRPVPGVLAAAIISIPTFFLWNHPLGIVMYTLEALLISFFIRKTRFYLLLSAGIVWLLIIPPLSYTAMTVSGIFFPSAIRLLVLKYMVNGIFNAAIASVIFFAIKDRFRADHIKEKPIRASEAATNFFVVFTFVPMLVFMLMDSRLLSEEISKGVEERFISMNKVITKSLNTARQRYETTIKAIAHKAANTPITEIDALQKILKEYHDTHPEMCALYIDDENARTITAYPALNIADEEFIEKKATGRPIFTETSRPKPGILDAYIDANTQRPTMAIAEPLFINNKFAGSVTGLIDPEKWNNNITEVMNKSMKGTLLNKQQQVLFASKDAKLSAQALSLKSINWRGGLKILQPSDQLVASKKYLLSTIFSDSVVAATNDWHLIIEEPMFGLVEDLFQMSFKQFSNVVGLILAMLLFSEIINRFFSVPLLRLAQHTSEIATTGSYDNTPTFPKSNIYEIQCLNNNFALAMAVIANARANEKKQHIKLLKVNLQLEAKVKQLKAAHLKIDKVEKSFATLVNSSPFLFILASDNGKVEFANDAFYRETKIANTAGRSITAILELFEPYGETPFDKTPLCKNLAKNRCQSGELSYTKDNQTTIFNCIMTFVEDRCMIILSNVTELALAKETKKRLAEQIQNTQKFESLGILAGGVAHDYNNILLAILGYAEMTLAGLPKNDPLHNNIKMIVTAAQRAAKLTAQMLAYTGNNYFISKTLNLSDLVKEMVPLIIVSIAKCINLKFNLENAAWAVGDDAQIRQIVMSLLMNAAEAIGEQPGTISISTGMCPSDDLHLQGAAINYLEAGTETCSFIEVADTGCGISAEILSKIFDPFFSTKFIGRGLGLAATMGIMKAHQGAIVVKNRPENGSIFRLILPVNNETITGHLDSVAEPLLSLPGKILLVDDDEAVLTITKLMLESCNVETVAAQDGEEGVKLFEASHEQLSLVMLDLVMPRLSGEEAFAQMKAINPDIPIIISSGFSLEETRSRMIRAEFDGFIQKPFKRLELLSVLANAVAAAQPKLSKNAPSQEEIV